MKKVNIFVDMDGVLAAYDKNVVELMYNEKFFLNRPQVKSMVDFVKELIKNDNYNIYILTTVIDSPYCIPEKGEWLNKNLSEISKSNILYVPHGVVKSEYAEDKVDIRNSVNVLIDDFTENLNKWTLEGAVPVKVMNGINGTNGSWLSSGGESIDAYSSTQENISKLNELIYSKQELQSALP